MKVHVLIHMNVGNKINKERKEKKKTNKRVCKIHPALLSPKGKSRNM
jgi:hypothetical protein